MKSTLARFARLFMMALILATATVSPRSPQPDAGPSVLRDTETELLFKQMTLPLILAGRPRP